MASIEVEYIDMDLYTNNFSCPFIGSETKFNQNDVEYNQTGDEHFEHLADLKQPLYLIVIYCVAYGIVFLFALIGNLVVIAVVCKNRTMHTLTNFFIGNLALADVLVAVFCMPISLLSSLFTGWRYGAVLCKMAPYMQGVSVCASVNTLVAIAMDRYLAICFTLEHKMTWRIAKITVCLIWTMALALMFPWLLYYKLAPQEYNDQVIYYCVEEWPYEGMQLHFLLLIIIVCYLLPLILIIACYCMIAVKVWTRKAPGIFGYSNIIQRSKVKVLKMMAVIVFLFGISWLPLYTLFLYVSINPPDPEGTIANVLYNICVPIAHWLGMSNSGINPIIYCFFSKSIRKRMIAMLSCTKVPNIHRRTSRFSSTRFMSVDYTNGHITLKLDARRKKALSDAAKLNVYCESRLYE